MTDEEEKRLRDIFSHPDLNTHTSLSEGEHGRIRTALEKYGIPLALMGVAARLAKRDGQAPEAAVAALSGYMRGVRDTAERRRKEALEKQKAQMEFGMATMGNMTRQGRQDFLNNTNQQLGGSPTQFPSAQSLATDQARSNNAILVQQTRFKMGSDTAMNARTEKEVNYGADMIAKDNPELGDVIRAAGMARLPSVENDNAVVSAAGRFFRPGMTKTELESGWSALQNASPDAAKIFIESAKARYTQDAETSRAGIAAASRSQELKAGRTLAERIGEARVALASVGGDATKLPGDMQGALWAGERMDGQDPLSREARARAYDSFKKIKSRSATMTFGLTPTEVEYHRRIYSPSPEEKLNTPDQNDRENGVLNDMVRDYRYSRELGVTSVPMKPPVINDDGDPTDF